MKVYISGPIKDKEDLNRFNFSQAEDFIRRINGFNPINPHILGKELDGIHFDTPDELYSAYMKIDIRVLLDCDMIYMLHGWEESKGAKLEYHIAKMIGLIIKYEGDKINDQAGF
jgi:hypothetical protein